MSNCLPPVLKEAPVAINMVKGTKHAAKWSYRSKSFKLKKTIEIQLVGPTVVHGKV